MASTSCIAVTATVAALYRPLEARAVQSRGRVAGLALPKLPFQRNASSRQRSKALVRAEADEQPPPSTPSKRAFTGYVQKDTAGQENIYAVEPTVYVGDSAFSTSKGRGDTSSSSSTLVITAGLAVAAVAGAAAILFTVGKSPLAAFSEDAYVGPPLSYYIQKFEDPAAIQGFEAFDAGPVAAPTATSEKED